MSGGGGSYVPETPLEKEQAQVAQAEWGDYNRRWLPVVQYYSARTQGGLPAKRAYLEGQANADLQGRFGDAAASLGRGLAARGLQAGSNADIFRRAALAGSQGSALGLGRSNADDAVERQYQLGLSDIIQMGRGQKTSSDQALSDLSALSGRQAVAQADIAAENAAQLGEAVGSGLRVGADYGMRDILNAQTRRASSAPPPGAAPMPGPDQAPVPGSGGAGANYMQTAPALTDPYQFATTGVDVPQDPWGSSAPPGYSSA